MPAGIGPLAYRDLDAVSTDIANLWSAIADVEVEDAFMTAAPPGVIARVLENQHHPIHEEYLFALAEVMKVEYDANMGRATRCSGAGSSCTLRRPTMPPATSRASRYACTCVEGTPKDRISTTCR